MSTPAFATCAPPPPTHTHTPAHPLAAAARCTLHAVHPDKGGIAPDESASLVKHIMDSCPHINFAGLMTIGEYGRVIKPGETNPDFEKLARARTPSLPPRGGSNTALRHLAFAGRAVRENVGRGATRYASPKPPQPNQGRRVRTHLKPPTHTHTHTRWISLVVLLIATGLFFFGVAHGTG